ncbi:MAG TPA: protein kinase [Thermoanaerobaculia bacterium]|nr:protein kinase [Thermoanaerobaculia bacterium]
MDRETWERIKQLFAEAREREGEARSDFLAEACGADTEVRREVESLLVAHSEISDSFIGAPAADAALAILGQRETQGWIGRRIGAYRLLAELGSGGMGTVFLAARADAEFERKVAIKLIRLGLDREEIVARFRQERQILAGLDHPNIARLLDGGATEEGLPYLVMEHVEGLPIDRYCAERDLGVRERLFLFLKVCGAVQYAHRNLIVHRDLKPSNILVTAEGGAKLLDFGIAKLLELDIAEGLTSVGERLLTPDYASPEQVLGEPITTSSDVYSLGILLYQLLSGQPPYRVASRSQRELERVVCEEEPVPPSTALGRREAGQGEGTGERMRRELRGDIDNIVMTALSKEPARRYSSVEQFAEDIERHLAGRPVLARRGGRGYRLGKFLRRHRLGVSAAGTIVLLLIAGVVGIVWQAGVARAQRDLAVRAANSMIYELAEGLSQMSGPTESRLGLLTRAAAILDEAQKGPGSPALARLQADSNRVLAQTYLNLGDLTHAADRVRLAERQARRLVARPGVTLDDRSALAGILIEAGDVHTAQGDVHGASTRYDEALALFEVIRRSPGATIRMRLATALALFRKGDRVYSEGKVAAAGKLYQESLEITQALARENARDPKLAGVQATTLERVGDVLDAKGDDPGACRSYAAALAIRRSSSLRAPSDPSLTQSLAIALQLAGWCAETLGKKEDALVRYQESIALERRLLAADPSNRSLTTNLIGGLGQIGNVLRKMGRFEEAIGWYRQALELSHKLLDAPQRGVDAIAQAASLEQLLGSALVKAGHLEEATKHLDAAADLNSKLLTQDPANLDYQRSLAEVFAARGGLASRGGKPQVAESAYEQAVAACRRLTAGGGSSANLQLLAETEYRLALELTREGKVRRARQLLREAEDTLLHLRAVGQLGEGSDGAREVLPAVERLFERIGR